jgi:hypothetical protein
MEAHEAGDNGMQGQTGPPTLKQVQAEFERRFAEMTSAFSNELRDRDAQIEMVKSVQAPTTAIGTPGIEQSRAEAFPQKEYHTFTPN